MNRISKSHARTIRAGALALLAAAITTSTGCNAFRGHGKYTQEGASKARQRLDDMKSATSYDMARQAYLAGDLAKARNLVDGSIGLNPQVARSHVLRGRIMLEMGVIDQAIADFQRAEVIDPTNVEAAYFQAVCFERIVRREEALSHYLRAVDLDPTNAQYVIAATEMMIDLGQTDEAERFLNSKSDTFAHNAGVRQTLGHLALMRDDHATAVKVFNEARLLAPDDGAILEDLARAQYAVGNFGDAEMNVSRLLRDPANTNRRDLIHMRARCLTELNRLIEAREALVTLTTGLEGAADTEAWIGLGNVSYILKDMGRLRAASTRVIALAPDRPDGYMMKALWHRRMGDLDRALLEVDRTIHRNPQHATALTLKGIILADRGQFEASRVALGAALRADPMNASVANLLESVEQSEIAAAGEF